jgi:hypothetical protein
MVELFWVWVLMNKRFRLAQMSILKHKINEYDYRHVIGI